jgi:hypothetical protein
MTAESKITPSCSRASAASWLSSKSIRASRSGISIITATGVGSCGSTNVRMFVTPMEPNNFSRFDEFGPWRRWPVSRSKKAQRLRPRPSHYADLTLKPRSICKYERCILRLHCDDQPLSLRLFASDRLEDLYCGVSSKPASRGLVRLMACGRPAEYAN